jgi:hypothetical protein
MRYGLVLTILLVLNLIANAASPQDIWIGTYEFGEDGGKTTGGTVIFVHHELTVMSGDDGLIATLKSNGYQTSKDLICKVKAEGNKLLVYFESYGEDNVFEPYAKGELLLTLEKKADKGKVVIVTHWGKFLPIVPKNERSGKVYFVKLESIDTK